MKTNKKLYCDYQKEFVSPKGTISTSRGEFTDMPCSMIAEEMSDESMQKIADTTEVDMFNTYNEEEMEILKKYRQTGGEGMTREEIDKAEKMSAREFEVYESVAREVGMRYWEDLTEEECEELEKAIREITDSEVKEE